MIKNNNVTYGPFSRPSNIITRRPPLTAGAFTFLLDDVLDRFVVHNDIFISVLVQSGSLNPVGIR